jgi:hypothetical protein
MKNVEPTMPMAVLTTPIAPAPLTSAQPGDIPVPQCNIIQPQTISISSHAIVSKSKNKRKRSRYVYHSVISIDSTDLKV